MRPFPSVVATALALLAVPAAAQADGYIGAGVGANSSTGGALGAHFEAGEDADAGRLLLGQRFGIIAIEASMFGTDLRGASDMAGPYDYSTLSLGVGLKLNLPLFLGLEGYGKAGLNKTWLRTPDARENWDYDGRGHELGGGLQLNLPLPAVDLGIWLDYSHQETELRDDDRRPLDGDIDMLTLGASLGF